MQLVSDAKKEGTLTLIGLPHNWCGYGDLIAGFKRKYSIDVKELDPGASSEEQIQALRASEGPQSPDVVDIRYSSGPSAKQAGLLAPYKVSTWEEIPDTIKDLDGYWYADYYQVIAFEVNTGIIKAAPQDWPDLMRGEYKSRLALTGDPRESAEASLAVYSAALAAGGTLDNVQPGLDLFAKVNSAGNLLHEIATGSLVAKGDSHIRLAYTFHALLDRDQYKNSPKIDVLIPRTGRIGLPYVQAISKTAPHLHAAKLWMEYLYSDEGQLGFLKGYCYPARYQSMIQSNKIPADIAAMVPTAGDTALPTVQQLTSAQEFIARDWQSTVGADIKPAP